jgi:hypothetical protein
MDVRRRSALHYDWRLKGRPPRNLFMPQNLPRKGFEAISRGLSAATPTVEID